MNNKVKIAIGLVVLAGLVIGESKHLAGARLHGEQQGCQTVFEFFQMILPIGGECIIENGKVYLRAPNGEQVSLEELRQRQ